MRSLPRQPSRIAVVGLGRAGVTRNSVSCVLTKKQVGGFVIYHLCLVAT